MVFKLVRTDTLEPCKIGLPLGSHLFGRGKFLDCDDKRVSRSHGELIVTDDTITLKALHQNPCFYIKKGIQETQILKRNCETELSHGDKFGLLPDAFWYEVLHCTILDVDRKTPELDQEELNNIGEDTERTDTLSSNNDKTVFGDHNTSHGNDNSINGGDHDEGNESQSLLRGVSPSFTQDDAPGPVGAPRISPQGSPSLLPPQDQTTQNYDANDPAADDAERSANKRRHSPDTTDTDDEKRPRLDAVKQEPEDVKPGPSNDQGGASNAGGTNKADDSTPPKPAAPAGRERCMYGANCYRRNPQHKAQFAHPNDPDWGAGPRGVCPWGAGCRKTDPRHWRDHDHPPGVTPPPPNRPVVRVRKVQKKRRQSNDSEEEIDSPKADLIVTGKRQRKPLQLQAFSGSESENEDPYQTDESDDWQPDTQDVENTQSQGFTQDLLD